MNLLKLDRSGNIIYPYTTIYKDNPNTSFPDSLKDCDLSLFSVYVVEEDTLPKYNPSIEKLEETIPELVNNKWIIKYNKVPLTSEEILGYKSEIITKLAIKIQDNLDSFAKSRDYDNILSACSYANSSVIKFNQEGLRCIELRDATWNTFNKLQKDILDGTISIPFEYSEVESLFPELTW